MSLFGRVAGALAVAGGLLLSTPADARRIVVDGGESIETDTSIAGCILGSAAACAPQTLPFFLNLGGSLTNQIYVYDSGLISIGHAISPAVDPLSSDLASLGANVVAPFFVPGEAYGIEASPIIDFMIGGNFVEFDVPQTGFVVKFQHSNFLPLPYDDDASAFPIDNEAIAILSETNGNLNIEFVHGVTFFVFPVEGEPFLFSSSFDLNGANIGYSVGSGTFQFSPTSQSDLAADFRFSNLDLAASPVPEPATWLTMTIGFGWIGLMVRRRARPAWRSYRRVPRHR